MVEQDNDLPLIDELASLCDSLGADFKKRHSFSRTSARIWIRAGFKCEYCDRDLLTDEVVFNTCEYDHIIPKSKCKDKYLMSMETSTLFNSNLCSIEQLNNFALACRLCHKSKGSRFNPNDLINVYSGEETLTDEQRADLINCVREQRIKPFLPGYQGVLDLTRQRLARVVVGSHKQNVP